MKARGIRIAAVLAAAVMLAACGGSSGPSVAACKHAMRGQFASAVAGNQAHQSEPAACRGIPARTLEKLAGEILTGG